MTKHVLFLMSDTGGGHRAAAEAIKEALIRQHGDDVQVTLVDVFKSYTPFPYKYMPEVYPWWINHNKTSWGMSFKLSNTRIRAKVLSRGMYWTAENHLKKMVAENPADVVVCVHSILTQPAMQALMSGETRPPFVVVITDLVSTHYFWYERRAERLLLPTPHAYERGLLARLNAEQMRVTGLPVHPRFSVALPDKAEARKSLGWDPDLPALLVVGGGDGMGPLYRVSRALNKRKLPCQIAVIAGRNKRLKEKLDSVEWNQPTHIYPFVQDMPRLMAAADILLTKAGPATLMEACIAGLPMIMYDAIPGQEEGNVDYIVENNAGVFIQGSKAVAAAVEAWLAEGADGLAQRSRNARALGRPNAVWEIAEEIWAQAQRSPIPTVGERQRHKRFSGKLKLPVRI